MEGKQEWLIADDRPWWTSGQKVVAAVLFLNALAMMWLCVFGVISPWYCVLATLTMLAAIGISEQKKK